MNAVTTWVMTGVTIQHTANVTPEITAVKTSKTTVQPTKIALAIVHSAVANTILGRPTHCATTTAIQQMNAAKVKTGLPTTIAHALLTKLAAQMTGILKTICAVARL